MILFLVLKRLAWCAPEFSIIFSLVKASTLVPAKSLIFLLCGEIEFLQDLSCTQLPASAAIALLLLLFLWDRFCWSIICSKTQHNICLKSCILAKEWFWVKTFWCEVFPISASYDYRLLGFYFSPFSNFTFFLSHSKKGQVAENTTMMFSIWFYRSIPLNPKEDIMRVMIFDLIR